MEYLIQFNNDLICGNITVRSSYVDQTNATVGQQVRSKPADVVTDLIEDNQLVSSACLPIAKQIVIFERRISLRLPKIGDLFLGLVHNYVIDKVTFIISNYTDEFTVAGQLQQINNMMLWRISELPIVLLSIDDYENVNISIQIDINSHYNLQSDNREVFKACYGYFSQSIKHQLLNCPIYHIPLINKQYCLDIICGIWTVSEIKNDANST